MTIEVTGCADCPFVILRRFPYGHSCGAPHESGDWVEGQPWHWMPPECPVRQEPIVIVPVVARKPKL